MTSNEDIENLSLVFTHNSIKLKLDQEKVWRSYYKPSNLESFDHNNIKVELCNKKCRKIPPQCRG